MSDAMPSTVSKGATAAERMGLMFRWEYYEWLVGVGQFGHWPYSSAAMVESYWQCNGDPGDMAEWLMETLLADLVEQLHAAPPLVIDGVVFSPDQVVRYQLSLTVQGVIAGIEGHGETRH